MSRKYELKKRAESQEATRLRITEAAVELHGSVGPARTTISAVAERAGVQRVTVYRHFADETALFAACSAHWIGRNPPPVAASWTSIADGLDQMYAYYERTEAMMSNLLRDRSEVEPIDQSMGAYDAYIEFATGVLAAGSRSKRVRAAIGHALEFETWHSLVRRHGLSRRAAVDLMAGLVDLRTDGPGLRAGK